MRKRPLDEIVTEIQAGAQKATEKLAGLHRELTLPRSLKDLEGHFPEDTETELMGSDEICPSLPWDLHGNLAEIDELLHTAERILKRVGSRTPEAVKEAWVRRRLAEVEDPAASSVLCELFGLQPEAEELVRQSRRLAVRDAVNRRLEAIENPAIKSVLKDITMFVLGEGIPRG